MMWSEKPTMHHPGSGGTTGSTDGTMIIWRTDITSDPGFGPAIPDTTDTISIAHHMVVSIATRDTALGIIIIWWNHTTGAEAMQTLTTWPATVIGLILYTNMLIILTTFLLIHIKCLFIIIHIIHRVIIICRIGEWSEVVCNLDFYATILMTKLSCANYSWRLLSLSAWKSKNALHS